MFIDLKTIKVNNRVREDFSNIMSLAESLRQYGQIQPIVVVECSEPNYLYELIAGERRYRAAILSGWTEIEACLKETCSDFMKKEIELEENIQRKNLSWTEEIEAKRQIDELKRLQHGSATAGPHGTQGVGWKQEDTAILLNESPGTVSQDIQLAEALKNDLNLKVQLAPFPKNVAFKKMQQLREEKHRAERVKNNEIKIVSNLFHGDACSLVDNLEDESVALWLTDPPFAIVDLESASGTYGSMMKEEDNSDNETVLRTIGMVAGKMFDKMLPSAHFYMFFASEYYQQLSNILRVVGFHVDFVPLIWKKNRTTTPFRGLSYAQIYEPLLFGCKPPRSKYLHKSCHSVLEYSVVSLSERAHPFHKPPELIEFFIEQSSVEGDLVVDTFAGSGQTLKSAKKLHRQGIGFELSEENYHKALEFLQDE